tara:strand:+ start:15127 stop:15366 length:240 start_codon:yes stop_codon:yes gene_type:complete
MELNSTVIFSIFVGSIILNLIFRIIALKDDVKVKACKLDKAYQDVAKLSADNQYLMKKVEGMRGELNEIDNGEEQIQES